MYMEGKIISVNSSKEKGVSKKNIGAGVLRKNFGLLGDAHSGTNREVSLLGWERVQSWLKKRQCKIKNLKLKIKPGDFAENITTEGVDWSKIKIGDRIKVSPKSLPDDWQAGDVQSPKSIILEVTEIGKECHLGCAIRKLVGDCLMPKEGIFAKVIKGGKIKVGDKIFVSICEEQ